MKKAIWLSGILMTALLCGCVNNTTNMEINNLTVANAPSADQCTPNLAFPPTEQTTMQTQQVAKTNLLPTMSKEERKTLHTFLSNFSEAALYDFDVNNYTVTQVANFAIRHADINTSLNKASGYFKETDKNYPGYGRIHKSDIDKILDRYMGITIKDHSQYQSTKSINSTFYKDDHYYMPYADGEALHWSQATAMYDNGDGTYTVQADVYTSLEGIDNMYADITDWGLSSSDVSKLRAKISAADIDYLYSTTAIIKPKTYNGKSTYQLIKLAKAN